MNVVSKTHGVFCSWKNVRMLLREGAACRCVIGSSEFEESLHRIIYLQLTSDLVLSTASTFL